MTRTVAAIVGTCLLLLTSPPARAVDDDDPMFRWSPDKRVIAKQIEAALPAAERGLRQLQTASSGTQVAAAIESIFDSYRYLRAAEESGRHVEGRSAVKDPLATLRYDHIANVRVRLRWCRDNQQHLLAQEADYTARCLDGLEGAIRELRIVVVTLP
jgi:hypothetical protein